MTTSPLADTQHVENTLRDWYEAIHRHDLQTAADLLTASFLIVEHTEVLDKTQLLARLEDGMAYGTQTSNLVDFRTQVHGDMAWTTLRNCEVWIPNDGEPPLELEFVETVIFQKVAGHWLIERYHATNTNPLPPPVDDNAHE
jgi:ketosteroid isomerase-like protein